MPSLGEATRQSRAVERASVHGREGRLVTRKQNAHSGDGSLPGFPNATPERTSISDRVMPVWPGEPTVDHRLLIAGLGAALALSPAGQIVLHAWLGALPNTAVVLAILILGRVAFRNLQPLPKPLRTLAMLSAAMILWGIVVSLSSWRSGTSLRYLTKALLYGTFFWALTLACSRREHRRSVELIVLSALGGLALLGLVETAIPDLPLFSWLRVPHSLTIRPRIAAVLSSPNIFGGLMAVGVALSESMRSTARIGAPWTTALTSLFVLFVAQSGSRNAWTTLCVCVGLLLMRRLVGLARAAGILMLFAVCLLCLPVPRFQLGVVNLASLPVRAPGSSAPPAPVIPDLPVSAEHAATGKAPSSLADPLQSLSLREMLWQRGLKAWSFRPFRGIGFGVFSSHVAPELPGYVRNPNIHSLPLNILVESGIVGLALALAWMRTVFKGGGAGDAEATTIVPLMVALVVQVFDNFMYDPTFVLIFLSLCAATTAPVTSGLGERSRMMGPGGGPAVRG